MWINFGVLKSTKTTKTHPIETSQVSKSKSVGFDISSVYKDNDSAPKGARIFCNSNNSNNHYTSKKNFNGNDNKIHPLKRSESKVYINDMHVASDSYSIDMGSIDVINPIYLSMKEIEK